MVLFIFLGVFVGTWIYSLSERLTGTSFGVVRRCSGCGNDGFAWLPIVHMKGCSACNASPQRKRAVIEIITAALFYYVGSVASMISLAPALVLTTALVIITVTDLKTFHIYDVTVCWTAIAGLLFSACHLLPISMMDAIIGGLSASTFILFLAVVTDGGVGGGDIKLFGALGFWFGYDGTFAIMLLAAIIGSCVSIVMICLGIWKRKQYIALGPYIALATLLFMTKQEDLFNLVLWFLGEAIW